MDFIISIKNGPNGNLVVVTDKNIIGKIFEEGKLQLDLTKDFYKGIEKTEEEIKEIFKKAQHIHLTGEKSVALGIELSLINQDKILFVSGVPHAEMVLG